MGSEFCIIERACPYCIMDEDACNFETYWWWGFDPKKISDTLIWWGLGIYPSKFKYIWQELDSILSWWTNILVILGIGENENAPKKFDSKRLMNLTRYSHIGIFTTLLSEKIIRKSSMVFKLWIFFEFCN